MLMAGITALHVCGGFVDIYTGSKSVLTQRDPFYHHIDTKNGALSQHFVTHVVPPLEHKHFI
jgi:hypothetical protein